MRIGNTSFFSAGLFAQRALRNNQTALRKSVEKLSTGKRINRARDDAAGLVSVIN